ncbi:MAG: hypothetical protein ABSB49_11310 [Polyangia bacterium]
MEDATPAVTGAPTPSFRSRMKNRLPPSLLYAGAALALWLAPAVVLAGMNADPFARPIGHGPSPFHTAQAGQAALDQSGQRPDLHADRQPGRQSDPPAASTEAGKACAHDEECPANTVCEDRHCQAFEHTTDIILYRSAGRSTRLLPVYFAQRGTPGYRVVAPFYFHFWSQEGRSQIVAPFYWRVEDYLKRRVVLVIPPYVQSKEPGASSLAVWPLFYVSTKFGWAAPPFLSFKIGDPDHGRAFGMWLLLYFWTRAPDSKLDLLFPFAFSIRSQQSAFTWAVPLNFYWRSHDDKNLLALPFFYRNEHKDGGNFVSWLGYASAEGKNTNGAYLWLYWYGRAKASSYDVVFPLLWSFRSPTSNTTVLPPLFHYHGGETTLGTFAFLGWWGADGKAGSNWQLAFPFYFRASSAHGAKTFHLWPTGLYQRDDEEGSRSLTLLVPPLAYWRDKTSATDFELLYLRHLDIPGNARTRIIGPYYRRDDPAGQTSVLFPLFWYFHDQATGASAHTLLPFYFRRSSPGEKLTAAGIFPLWIYHRSFTDGGTSGGIFPLAFFGSRKGRSHAIVFPVFWRWHSQEDTTLALLPFFYRSDSRLGSSTGIIPLLYFAGDHQGQSYHFQIPFYWHFADRRSGTSTTVALPYFRYDYHQGQSYTAGVLPLLFWGGGGPQRHFTLFPLFWWYRDDLQDRTTTVIANYLHRRQGDEVTDAFFPFFHYRRNTAPGGPEHTSLTLFPFFHYRRNPQRTLFASPLAVWSRTPERKVGLAGPYFWYGDARISARLVPLLYLDHTQLDTGERTRMWGPYFAFDGPGHQARVLAPLWASYRNTNERGTFVFPTFFHLRRNDGYQLDTLFPLLWLSRSPDTRTTVVGPYFTHSSPDTHAFGLLPFYAAIRTPKRAMSVTPLYLTHENYKSGVRKTFAWLYYEARDPDGTFRTVFPLWWQAEHGGKNAVVLFPLFWHFADREHDRSTTLAGPLYSAHAGSEHSRGLLPLFWYSRDSERRSHSNALMPLFYEQRSRSTFAFLTLPFGYRRSGDTAWWYALNLVRKTSWQSSFHTFFPLWFYHHQHTTDTTTLVVPPLLHYARTSPARSLSEWFLLFWHKSDITSSATLGLPLVYDFHAYHQSRITMVFPFYFRYRNETTDRSTVISPLFFRYSTPTDTTTVALPLYWRFYGVDRATTVLFPFYFNVRRPAGDTTYIFPNLYYRKGLGPAAGTSHLVVFPFWESEVKRPGDYAWEVLLGLVGWERVGRNRFLKLLFIPIELEPAPAAKTAWYGSPPPGGRTKLARGLDVKSW